MEVIEKNANPVEELNTTTSSSIVMKPKWIDKKLADNKKSKLHQEYTDTKDNNQQTSEDLEQDILGKQVREELTVQVSSIHAGKKPYKSISIGMKPKRSNKKSSDNKKLSTITSTNTAVEKTSRDRNTLDQGRPKKSRKSEIDGFMNTYARATTYLESPGLPNIPQSPLLKTLIGCGYCREKIEMDVSKNHFQRQSHYTYVVR